MDRFTYSTKFNLLNIVIDQDAAAAYLLEDDMTKYLKDAVKVEDDPFNSIKWLLKTDDSGEIVLETNRKLTDDEKAKVSDWISGQCSDGLGEGFEQQPFACYTAADDPNYDSGSYGEYDEDEDDYDYDNEEYFMASFDWKSNNYELIER